MNRDNKYKNIVNGDIVTSTDREYKKILKEQQPKIIAMLMKRLECFLIDKKIIYFY